MREVRNADWIATVALGNLRDRHPKAREYAMRLCLDTTLPTHMGDMKMAHVATVMSGTGIGIETVVGTGIDSQTTAVMECALTARRLRLPRTVKTEEGESGIRSGNRVAITMVSCP